MVYDHRDIDDSIGFHGSFHRIDPKRKNEQHDTAGEKAHYDE
jgi:hypothetical protein